MKVKPGVQKLKPCDKEDKSWGGINVKGKVKPGLKDA